MLHGVIPADHKWFMRYAVSNIICERLEELQMSYLQLSKEETEQLKIYREHIMKEEEESKKKWEIFYQVSQIWSLQEIICKYLSACFVNSFIFSIFAIQDINLKAILVYK